VFVRQTPHFFSNNLKSTAPPFKNLAAGSGYTVTGAFERFMDLSVEKGALVFPIMGSMDYEAEARVLLNWNKKGEYWYTARTEEEGETSIMGRLLTLIPLIQNAELKSRIEKVLTE